MKISLEPAHKLLNGVRTLAEAVATTLGPKGRTAIIQTKGKPVITKDGVTVAKAIRLEDPVENLGAQIVKDVASKTASVAGDGTTTATILAWKIMEHATSLGWNRVKIQRSLQEATTQLVANLRQMSIPVTNKDMVARVAMVSSNWDPVIADFISQAFEHTGLNGHIVIEQGENPLTNIDLRSGFHFDTGWAHPNFSVLDGVPRREISYGEAVVLVIDRKLTVLKEIIPLLELAVRAGKPIVLIVESVDGEALAGLLVNHLKGACLIMAIQSPGFGATRQAWMEDIAAVCGCLPISESFGVPMADVSSNASSVIGMASVTVRDGSTVLMSTPDNEILQNHVEALQQLSGVTESVYQSESISERIARLTGKVAVITVGGGSEVEVREIKDRFDDAYHACRAAIKSGIIPGGGSAFLHASKDAPDTMGWDLLKLAIMEPFEWILGNAGISDVANIRERILEQGVGFGYDVVTDTIVNMLDAGVIDPTDVAIVAIENASSLAGTLLTSGVAVTEE